ncbi:ankyrin repeat domain-containing protein [Yinghuangia soli]|uniref:Ankyrin repeat domain-containing protein n=1 Tax=Yinghuangia soli TaxID=2908204 RepID=A0AA41PZD9_9ACTN|nr:ankyrin repeat domain-containing protein [Yinghuangia soli]MCF2528140.1 ankyrin repeat domain-containing protein [Yinghuangia soli]
MNRRTAKKLSNKLVLAVHMADIEAVRLLLRAGADADRPDADGTTPLYAAAVRGDAEIAAMLLDAGADPDRESGTGDEGLPLCGAAAWGHDDAVRALLAGGADPNAREDGGFGRTAIQWTTTPGYEMPETRQILKDAGAFIPLTLL